MTTGHRHRIVHLPAYGTRLHLLQTPLIRTADPDRAERSRLAWRLDHEPIAGDGPIRVAEVYTLTVLGLLHGLTGLTIETDEAP